MEQAIDIKAHPGKGGNSNDRDYIEFRQRMQDRFTLNLERGPLFTTNATDLWQVYLKSFPLQDQQFHNCNACRHFIERFGGLVTIDEKGIITPAIWNLEDSDEMHAEAVARMFKLVSRARVAGVFISSEQVLGIPMTAKSPKSGPWIHMTVSLPKSMVHTRRSLTAGQVMAEKAEDLKNVVRALNDFTIENLKVALTLLKSDSLYRAEKVLGAAQWLHDLHIAIKDANRQNVVWRAVALAPAGFCHPRSSMIGTLLEDIAAGMDFEQVSRRFRDKMDPLHYRRPQAAPSAGNIAQAEKLISELNAAGSLARRYARLDEVQTIWRPQTETPTESKGGIFSHLKTKGEQPAPEMNIPAQVMTWEKFQRTILPTAKAIECHVPMHGQFIGLVTATNSGAPPIIQWDTEEQRNPFSWYVYVNGSSCSDWGLSHGWVPVNAITYQPSMWFERKASNFSPTSILILEGAKDVQRGSGLALFPEILKSEFHGIRAVLEAFSHNGKLEGREEASANGLIFAGSNSKTPVTVRVTDTSGTRLIYKVDRWD